MMKACINALKRYLYERRTRRLSRQPLRCSKPWKFNDTNPDDRELSAYERLQQYGQRADGMGVKRRGLYG